MKRSNNTLKKTLKKSGRKVAAAGPAAILGVNKRSGS